MFILHNISCPQDICVHYQRLLHALQVYVASSETSVGSVPLGIGLRIMGICGICNVPHCVGLNLNLNFVTLGNQATSEELSCLPQVTQRDI
ncbi:unnamed protein product [Ceratitis capitata]|uniref:(Mediterranean fruit fly) hypothetical protein n=1 Tax=Ceratitis capitata TaxID=7213 RepID=A0A811UQI6_CERCA|nr:unnamed protein product [Ceratitis capitata]